MSKSIPIYQLSNLSDQEGNKVDVFMLGKHVEKPQVPIELPFRSNFYKIGICLNGKAELLSNLETYHMAAGFLVITPPHIIKQWTYFSPDFDSIDLFFTEDFITRARPFRFMGPHVQYAFKMSAAQAMRIKASLQFIQEKYNEVHPFRDEILKNQIGSFLFEVEAVFEAQRAEVHQGRTRSEQLTAAFKQLVNLHFKKERNLQFYAAQLCITSKHLSETVRAVTGKTGGDWITAAVILEAKVLLQSPELSIAQISDLLHFSDQSTFGKFFKNQTGMSPAAYKQTL